MTDVVKLPTQQLPAEVVKQDLVVGIYSLTPDPAEPRQGTLNISWRLGDRDNPGLTEDEYTYVLANLEEAVRWWQRHAPEILE